MWGNGGSATNLADHHGGWAFRRAAERTEKLTLTRSEAWLGRSRRLVTAASLAPKSSPQDAVGKDY